MARFILLSTLLVGLVLATGCQPLVSQPMTLVESGTLKYPPAAKEAGVMGYVVVSYDVLVDGNVANVEVVQAEPPGVFDEEAVRFVKTWLFRPAYEEGQPVELQGVESSITFELEGQLIDEETD